MSDKNYQHFIRSKGGGGCGLCAFNNILTTFNLSALIFPYSKTGISPKKINLELCKEELDAEIRDRMSAQQLRCLKVPAILWYPPNGKNRNGGHYVVFEGVDGDRARICDSDNSELEWLSFSELEKRWYRHLQGAPVRMGHCGLS